MPKSLVEVRREYTKPQERAILAAVQDALVTAFRIPERDGSIRLVVHEPDRFACSPAHDRPEFFTLVTIEAFSGRSLEAKRRLYTEIVDRLAPLGIPRDHVTVVLHEIPRDNWGIRGGRAAVDVELDFTVEV